MKKQICSYIIFLLTLTLFADKEVDINEDVQSFFNDMNNMADVYHKSGFANKSKSLVPSEGKKSWKDNCNHSYAIVENAKIAEKVKNNLFGNVGLDEKKYIQQIFYDKSTALVEKKSSPKPTDILDNEYFSKEDYKEMAKYYLSGVNDLEGKYEVENVAYETAYCSDCDDQFYKQKRISGVYVRMRRVFEGGVVRGGTSKILIKLDPDGSLRKLKIKWPEFQKIEKTEKTNSFDENIDFVINKISKNDDAHIISKTATVKIDRYEIIGAAKAWIPVRNKGKITLIPSISYILNLYLGDDSEVKKIVDNPIITEYSDSENKQ